MRIHLVLALLSALLAGCAGAPDAPPGGTAPTTGVAPAVIQEDFQTFTLGSGQDIEWKYRLAEGASMDYSWSADRPVRFDFHGDRDDGTDAFVSHKKATLASDAGAFEAPFSGRHGWYFHNGNTQAVTIELAVEGALEVVGRTGGSAP